MNSATFEFKSEKNWLRVCDALYYTDLHYASYGYLAITVWGDDAIAEVKSLCKKHRIAIKEI